MINDLVRLRQEVARYASVAHEASADANTEGVCDFEAGKETAYRIVLSLIDDRLHRGVLGQPTNEGDQ